MEGRESGRVRQVGRLDEGASRRVTPSPPAPPSARGVPRIRLMSVASPVTSPSAPRSGLVLRGLTLGYLGVMVLLPLFALAYQAAEPGPRAFWEALTDPLALHALKLTFITA